MVIDTYFRLNSECHLIKGATQSVIYNLLTGDIISLNQKETNVILQCEANVPIESSVSPDLIKLLKTLEETEIGSFFDQPVYIDKYRYGFPRTISKYFRETAMLQYAYLEVTNNCDLDCYFCREEMNVRRVVSMGCSRWKMKEKNQLKLNDWKKVLNQLYDLGCMSLIIRGGDPLILKNKFKNIVKYCRSLNFKQISVITNGINLHGEYIDFFKKYSIHPMIQILSNKSEVHDLITRKKGSFNTLVSNLEELKKVDLRFSLSLLVLDYNQNHVNEIMTFYRKLSPNISVNYFYPGANNGLQGVPLRFINRLFITKENLPKTSLNDITIKNRYNSCLFGRLAVTSEGDVLPCIGMRDEIIGNLKEEELYELFSKEKFDTYWGLSGDKIDICRDCEYRYLCGGCRLIEKNATGSLYGRKFCTYNPYNGKWSKPNLRINKT